LEALSQKYPQFAEFIKQQSWVYKK
jgi:hypothetical protein